MKPNYENWVHKGLIYGLGAGAAALAEGVENVE